MNFFFSSSFHFLYIFIFSFLMSSISNMYNIYNILYYVRRTDVGTDR